MEVGIAVAAAAGMGSVGAAQGEKKNSKKASTSIPNLGCW
jgi:hypothetical protein